MNENGGVTIGLIVFVALATLPFWYGFTAGDASPPEVPLPTDGSTCVESADYMRANHMDLLNRWRDEVVRDGVADPYISERSGKAHVRSLTKTCLGCHTDRNAFCTECHNYANVKPLCWECHLAETKRN